MKKIYKRLTSNELSLFARIVKQSKLFFPSFYTINTQLYYIYIILKYPICYNIYLV